MPGENPEREFEAQREVRGVGQRSPEGGRQAVGGNDVEPDPRTHDDACRARHRILLHRMLEHADLAGNVEVVRMRSQARGDHRGAGGRERTGAMQNQAHALQRRGRLGNIAKIEDACFQAERVGEWRNFPRTAAGKDGLEAAPRGLARDQLSGVAVRPIDHPGLVHAGAPPWARNA